MLPYPRDNRVFPGAKAPKTKWFEIWDLALPEPVRRLYTSTVTVCISIALFKGNNGVEFLAFNPDFSFDFMKV
ncbi:serine/threonine-protein kinase tricorner-like [Gossypium australe]|uniref:Serine/threonine-protein kinase tricorner-like n=1 Tax=Gossypium australe TaxID=47621 RepID=A0A5B6WVD1_9ROSI|nr:serine/threonine-protein kinase tricorner-like [Gossypium australe]